MKQIITNSEATAVVIDFKTPGKSYNTAAEGNESTAPFDSVTIEPGKSHEIDHTGWTRSRLMSDEVPADFTAPNDTAAN